MLICVNRILRLWLASWKSQGQWRARRGASGGLRPVVWWWWWRRWQWQWSSACKNASAVSVGRNGSLLAFFFLVFGLQASMIGSSVAERNRKHPGDTHVRWLLFSRPALSQLERNVVRWSCYSQLLSPLASVARGPQLLMGETVHWNSCEMIVFECLIIYVDGPGK